GGRGPGAVLSDTARRHAAGGQVSEFARGGDESYVRISPDRSDWEKSVGRSTRVFSTGRSTGDGHSRPRSLSDGRRRPMTEMLGPDRLWPAGDRRRDGPVPRSREA